MIRSGGRVMNDSGTETGLQPRPGATIVEIAIVVVILGLLAGLVLPRVAGDDRALRQQKLQQNLDELRSQIELYQHQHAGRWPGEGSEDPADMINALLSSSDVEGNTGPVGTLPMGPYFIDDLPPNPVNEADGVRIVEDIDAAVPDGNPEIGWIYSPRTGRIKPNTDSLIDAEPETSLR